MTSGEGGDRFAAPLVSERAAQLGLTVQLLNAAGRRGFSLGAVFGWTWPAIRLGQVAFLFDGNGQPLAFATWAFLSEPVSQRMAAGDVRLLDISEWNEGDRLWIVDIVAPYGHCASMARRLRALLSCHFTEARGVRWRGAEADVRTVRFSIGRTGA